MWLIAEYQPTALFSLKPAWATSSGGKSLLLPTPFAIKMALLDAVCRADGVRVGEKVWSSLSNLHMALRGPERIVVNNTFTRVLKPMRSDADDSSGAYQRTIGFREYVYFEGSMGIGLGFEDSGLLDRLMTALLQVNYFGKRGSFVQLLSPPEPVDVLPNGFLAIEENIVGAFQVNGILHQLDDTGPMLTFDQVNIYSDKNIRLGKERVLKHVILPYRLVRSSKAYTYYERIDIQ